MQFEFITADRILFGPGTLSQVAPSAAEMGERVLLVVGRDTRRAASLVEDLESRGMTVSMFSVHGEPTTETAAAGLEIARNSLSTLVIGMGGGAVMDAGKVIAALLTNTDEMMTYLEVIGEGKPIQVRPAPYIAVPTTAGTGAEVTRNAVLGSPEHRVKVSMRSPLMLPRLAVVDPEMTYSLPPEVTASTGLDALTQLLEAFVSCEANPLTDGICKEGLVRAGRSLPRAFRNGEDAEAREEMCLASLFGGLALANAKLGAVHGLAAPLGGMFPAPHGVVCARLLPHVMAANVEALRREGDAAGAARFDEAARLLTGNPLARAEEGVAWVEALCRELNVAPLATFGVLPEAFPELISKSRSASSMKGNPAVLTEYELTRILERAVVPS